MMDAVVLAGGIDKGEIAAETGITHRALLDIGGRTIIHREVAALRGATQVGNIALVAPAPVQAAVTDDAVDFRVESTDSFVENIALGVDATAPGTDQVLVITGDLPFVTSAALNDFVQQSVASRADVAYSIVPRESAERQFPGGRRTYARLREGTFTGGNAVTLTRDVVRRQRDLIEHLYAARKNPLRLASVLGFSFIISLLAHRLSLPQLEAKASRVVGARVAAIITSYAEIGFDVDKLSDLYLARRVVESFDAS
jgi:GTP:adenosylcobinamide-phosphate guanylyltransferase